VRHKLQQTSSNYYPGIVKLIQQLQYKGPQLPTYYDYSSLGEHDAYGGITQSPQPYPQQGYIPPSQLLNAQGLLVGNDYSSHHHGRATGTGLIPIPFWIIVHFSIPCSITQNRMGTRLHNRMSSLFKYTPHFLDRISTLVLFLPRPQNCARKSLCNLRTLKSCCVNIPSSLWTLDTFIAPQLLPAFQI